MKYSLLSILSLAICIFISCDDDEVTPPVIEQPVTTDCIDDIIDDLTENDNFPDCMASVKLYTFEGDTVYNIQEDACLDGSNFILNEICDTLCVINVFGQSIACSESANFYEDAEFIELLWQEN